MEKEKIKEPDSKGVVKYDYYKFLVSAESIITIAVLLMLLNAKSDVVLLILLFAIGLPLLIFSFFMFRFCVRYDATKRQIEYRRFFGFRTIGFDDIERIYKKSDKSKFFLIIEANGHKVGMNTQSCNGTKELLTLLKDELPQKCEVSLNYS